MPRYNRYNRYNRKLATKRYVNKAIHKADWSPIQRCTYDFQNVTVGSITNINLTDIIGYNMGLRKQYTTQEQLTDGDTTFSTEYKIAYIRVHTRCALGEGETVSAVSQTVRYMVWRSIQSYSESPGVPISDVDGCPRYSIMYGDINGIWLDTTFYLHSWATDGDTTAGGQHITKKLIRPKHSDTLVFDSDMVAVDNEKGTVFFSFVGDDPDGVNASVYGYIEIGYIYKSN